MKQEQFNTIIKNIASLCKQVKINRDELNKFDMRNLSKEKLSTLIDSSTQLMSDIDSILKSEFYHLIGMADLSSSQVVSLCKNIKELGKMEDLNKRNLTIFTNLKGILTSLSSDSEYTLKKTINLKLQTRQQKWWYKLLSRRDQWKRIHQI